MLNVPVVMLVAAAAVLAGVVYVATGRGGELAFFQADYAPLKMDEVTSTDVALFRPPTALWGYSMQATDEALSRIASAITERDIEISALQQQVADLEASTARRRAYARPEDSPRPEARPARRGPDRPARLPEPDVIGSAAQDQAAMPPDRPAQQDEPRRGGPDTPPGERPDPEGADDRDIWRPATRAAGPASAAGSAPATGSAPAAGSASAARPAPAAGPAPATGPLPAARPGPESGRDGTLGAEPGDNGAPATFPWVRRTADDPSAAAWAALPKRQPPGEADADEDGR